MKTIKSLIKIALKPTTIVFTVVSLLGAPVFSACKYGGHLKVAIPGHFTSMDPHLGRSGWDAYLWRQFTDHLVDADRSLNPRPMSSLAEKWEVSSNPDALTLTLRKGIEFHDGTPFNAEAVKANIERILDPANSATPRSSLAIIQSVDVLSENKVRLNLSGPWGAGLSQLADRGGAMNSPTAISKLGEDYGAKAVGTGPFVIKSAHPSQKSPTPNPGNVTSVGQISSSANSDSSLLRRRRMFRSTRHRSAAYPPYGLDGVPSTIHRPYSGCQAQPSVL